MPVRIRLSPALADYAGVPREFVVDAREPLALGAVLTELDRQSIAAGRRVRDETGTVRRHVNVFVDAEECRRLDGLDTLVGPDAVVDVIGAVSGG